jgi:hypothetical protein
MKIDDMFLEMVLMMLMDEQLRLVNSKEADSPEKVEIDLDEIDKAEKMYE